MQLSTLPPDKRAAEYAQLGRDYFNEGLLPEAERQFQSAIEADGRSSEAHAGLAQIRDASGDTTQARSQAEMSNQLKPNATAYMVLARLDLAANQLQSCANDVSGALKAEPGNTAAAAMKVVLQQRGQSVE
jgi:lipopolysaccharide biosynthesis regulator YciM